jgi:integrase
VGHVKDRWLNRDRTPTARYGTGLRWQVKYRVDGREKDGGSFAKKSQAEDKLIELESNLRRGAWVDPTNTTTVAEWMRLFVETLPGTPRTLDRYRDTIRLHVAGTPLGATRLNQLRPSIAQTWVADRSRVIGPGHLQTVVGRVKRALKAARADRLTADDPFVDVTLPGVERERIVPLTAEQVSRLADIIGLRYRAMVITQAGLGLRIGELLALRVQDVDFLRRTVRIETQIDEVTGQAVDPKTRRSRRTIPLPTSVGNELAAHMQRVPPIESGTHRGLIFHTSNDRPFLRQAYRTRTFKNAVRRAHHGIKATRTTPGRAGDSTFPLDTTPHDLRHFFASVQLAAGESVVHVAELLGHKNARLVLETYGHLMPGREDHARRAIDDAFAPSPVAVTSQERPQ